MRTALFALAALFYFVLSVQLSHAQHACAGSCDGFGNPVYNVPPSRVSPNPPGFVGEPRIDTPPPLPRYVDVRPRQPRSRRHFKRRHHHRRFQHRRSVRKYRTRRHHAHRRHFKRRHHRTVRRHRVVRQHRSIGRTQFCRNHIEYRGHQKVKVHRCIWVRNDLVPNYRADRRYRSTW